MTRISRLLPALLPVLLLACSDNNDPTGSDGVPPKLTVSDQAVAEGNTCLFSVALDKAAPSRVIFDYTTEDLTATSGVDYTAVSGTDTITTGQQNVTVLVPTIDDGTDEPDMTFQLVLSAISGATVSDSVAVGTIIDNDAQVSYSAQVQPLLRTSCAKASCHASSPAGGSLVLGVNADYNTVINATGTNTALLPGSQDGKVVQPGSSATSTLYTKTTSNPPFGNRMPYQAVPLTVTQQNLIRDWIDQGAQDN
jgi:hypothetical protein